MNIRADIKANEISDKQIDGQLAQAMLSSSPECVKLLEPDGTLVYMSRNGMELMEIPDFSMVKGKLWWDLWPEKHRELLVDAVSVACRGVSFMFEADCPTAAGTEKYWQVRLFKINGGHLDGYLLASSQDITDKQAVEQISANLKIENEALSRFSRLIAHDLRNPIRQMGLMAQMLQEVMKDQQLSENATRLLTGMQSSAGSLLELMSGLQTLHQWDKPVSDNETMTTVEELLSAALSLAGEDSMKMVVESAEPDLSIIGNKGLLVSVFKNVLESITANATPDNPAGLNVKIDLPENDKVVISFEPRGPGNNHANNALTEPENNRSTAGLDLVKRIVEGHSGTFEVLAGNRDGADARAMKLSFPHVKRV